MLVDETFRLAMPKEVVRKAVESSRDPKYIQKLATKACFKSCDVKKRKIEREIYVILHDPCGKMIRRIRRATVATGDRGVQLRSETP